MTNVVRVAALIGLTLGSGNAAALDAGRLVLAAPDTAAVLAADALRPAPQPYRFAVPIAVRVTPQSHGSWTLAGDGLATWQLQVAAPGAQHLNLAFTSFALPAGAALSVSAPDGSERHGPYGPEHAQGQLWTPVVRGAEVAIELTVPAARRHQVSLALTRVNYGFRGFGAKDEAAAKSGACNVDVACPEGDEWRDEIRSVARISINGLFLCTGQMMNNTALDFTPYFLTAAHCLSTEVEAQGTVFYWNYQTAACGDRPNGKLGQNQSGATLVASSRGTDVPGPDFTLLKLLQKPDPAFAVYYSGWDNRDLAPLGVTGIHHPAGDEKRISFEFDQTFIANYGEEPESVLSQQFPTHIKIPDWDVGTTEGGSSGSGIWNSDHRLVGQLSGGSAACGNNSPDWYGRFHADWFGLETPLTSVAPYLDPLNSGAEVLDGADPAATDATKTASGSSVIGAGALPSILLLGLLLGALARRRA